MNKLKEAISEVCGDLKRDRKTQRYYMDGKSMAQLAAEIGVAETSLSRWTTGVRKPKLVAKMKINEYFGYEVFPYSEEERETAKLCLSVKGLVGKED